MVARQALQLLRFRHSAQVPNTPISITVHRECPQCAHSFCIQFVTTYKGDEMLLTWLCRECGHEWPITRKEPHPVPPET